MRMFYARSKKLTRLFPSCNRDVLIELGKTKSFCDSFHCSYFLANYKNNHRFLRYVLHTNDLYRKMSRRSSASQMLVSNNIIVHNFEAILGRDTYSFTPRLKCSRNLLISTLEKYC